MAIEISRSRALAAAICGVLALSAVPRTVAAQNASEVVTGALEEVVVTARKREESLQDTPISVTAFTAQGLADRGMVSTKDLGTYTPNLISNNGSAVSGNNSAGAFFIRGIGQIDFTLNTDPGVGLYLDEVYIARSIGAVMDLLDLQAVEVLRGPQGTLFGRNTIGGAISMRSQPPAQELGGTVEVEVGSDNLRRARFSADMPLSATLLTRFSASYTDRDGFVRRTRRRHRSRRHQCPRRPTRRALAGIGCSHCRPRDRCEPPARRIAADAGDRARRHEPVRRIPQRRGCRPRPAVSAAARLVHESCVLQRAVPHGRFVQHARDQPLAVRPGRVGRFAHDHGGGRRRDRFQIDHRVSRHRGAGLPRRRQHAARDRTDAGHLGARPAEPGIPARRQRASAMRSTGSSACTTSRNRART